MNALFSVFIVLSLSVLIAREPNAVLPAMGAGAQKALTLTLQLATVYAVWLGVMEIAKECGITARLSRLLRRPINALFGSTDRQTQEAVSTNLAANALGMGGVATPMGRRAMTLLDNAPDARYRQSMLFVINATSIQLLPTSVLSMRAAAGSVSAGDIMLPTLLTTALTTAVGIILVRLIVKRRAK